MKTLNKFIQRAAILVLALAGSTGCETTDGDGSNAGGSVYYGMGINDPWYYGGYHDDPDIIVTPPPRPVLPVHPEQPIARPTPQPRPMPSIPSTPRPMPRPAMRR